MTLEQMFRKQESIHNELTDTMCDDWTNDAKIRALRIELREINRQIVSAGGVVDKD